MLLKDIAEMASVSLSTVSRALHNDERISEATRLRIQAIAEREHFLLSKSASALASRKSFRISALFVDRFNTWFTSTSFEGLYTTIAGSGYDLFPIVLHTPEQMDSYFRSISENKNTDGIIIASILLSPEQSSQLADANIPIVGLDSQDTEGYDAAVLLDNTASMRDAAEHIRDLGHPQVGLVEFPQPGSFRRYSFTERIPTFELALGAAGYDPRNVQRFRSENNRADAQGVASLCAQILSAQTRPTVLFVETDDFAITLIAALQQRGIQVPRDISVIGFDDNAASELVGLVTFHQDALDDARLAASKLLDILNGRQLAEAYSGLIPKICVFCRACWGGLVSCPAFADV
ncbi:LacI family DNA-binding transcriptional regulator [Varibaculum prostatecancerukia]|uniref:LacI family DNA-binding transcriptional regulator n=2 Tax=Varibaculum prostatecancerukia TaxID=2811781 RepID=UPI00286931CD|nr:LacI family DNA-binding transcriptional regulator [Varibaculum prostatecancerukia]